MADRLTDDQVRDALAALPGWTGDASGLVRDVEVDETDRDYLEEQVRAVGAPVERTGSGVRIVLGADGGVTPGDVELAAHVDRATGVTGTD